MTEKNRAISCLLCLKDREGKIKGPRSPKGNTLLFPKKKPKIWGTTLISHMESLRDGLTDSQTWYDLRLHGTHLLYLPDCSKRQEREERGDACRFQKGI